MTAIAEQLFKTAMALGDEERIALAQKIIGSVSSESEIYAAHLAVAHERLEELLSEKVTPVTREETLKQVQELLSKGSAA